MTSIKANIGTQPYKIDIESTSGNTIVADEPLESGGGNKGFSPKELLASALAACTCATIRMYANHKNWDVGDVDVNIEIHGEPGQTKLVRGISFTGNLNPEQRARLLNVANACPLHKILSNPIAIDTTLV